MLDNGLTTLTGRLWFVGAVVVSGHFIALGDDDDDTLFNIVTDELGMGEVPAIVFDPRGAFPQVRYYPAGLNDTENCKILQATASNVSLERIFEAIGRIYDECLVTPDAQSPGGKLWKDSRRGRPYPDAEARIQTALKVGLVMAFPLCTVRHEQASVSGRSDLEIEEGDPLDRGKIARHAVLELKVLRSVWSNGAQVSDRETCEWIEGGVKQAATYRKDKSAAAAALCCFDMRKENLGETCFEHVLVLAADLDVKLRRWFLYSTDKRYRDATI